MCDQDEEDAYMEELWSESEEDYGHDSGREELEPKPPDSDLYRLSQHKCYELEAEGRGELLFKQPDNTRRSTWSRSHNTSQSSKSMVHFDYAYHSSTPKIQLYSFSGKRSYLEWERNMEDWFYYNYIRKEERMEYAVGQLNGEAYKGWLQEKEARRFYKERPITTWEHLKKLLRDQYVPKHKNKAPATMELPKKKAAASTSSKRQKPVNKQIDPHKETSLNGNNKRIEEAFTAMMEQIREAFKAVEKSQKKKKKSTAPQPSDLALKEIIIPAKSTPTLLLGTKISETHDLVQYWQNFITGHSFKYSVFKMSIPSMIHLFCPMSDKKETGALEQQRYRI